MALTKEFTSSMKRKTVSLCIIARDEEGLIGKAIKSALALVDEIVVVDTGSRDNTRIIAEGYGARVVDYAWHDDFAAARNAAIGAASCDWILVLDCDEQLQGIRPVDFQALLVNPSVAGYRVRMVGSGAEAQSRAFPAVRLFRNHPNVRYRYPVLEQVTASLSVHAEATGLVLCDSPLVVMHDGGTADERSRKRDRNLRLLRQAVRDYPEEPYFEFRLGSETLMRLDGEALPVAGLGASLKHLESAWRKVSTLPPEMRRLVAFGTNLASDLASALLGVRRAADAITVTLAARRDWGDNADLCHHAIRARLTDPEQGLAEGFPQEGLQTLLADLESLEQFAAQADPEVAAGFEMYGHRCRGDLALIQGNVTEAAESYEQALNHSQEYSGAWVGLAECARLAGDRKRALRLYLRAVTASEWNVQAWDRGCTLMEELGFHDNAKSWQVKVMEHFPERAAAVGEPELKLQPV